MLHRQEGNCYIHRQYVHLASWNQEWEMVLMKKMQHISMMLGKSNSSANMPRLPYSLDSK